MQRTAFISLLLIALILSLLLAYEHQIIRSAPLAMSHTAPGACVDIPANPDYLSTNSEQDAIAAINNARKQEHLHPLHLPANFYLRNPPQQQFILLNLERTDRGRRPLHWDTNLAQMAWGYSKQLLDLHFFSHTSPIAGTFSERINSNPAISNHYSVAAENLAGNPVPGAGPIYEYMYDDTVEGCGHRNNILDPALTLVGIGWLPGGRYGSISAQELLTPAPWNSYLGAAPDPIAPTVHIVDEQCKGTTYLSKFFQYKNVGAQFIAPALEGDPMRAGAMNCAPTLTPSITFRAISHDNIGVIKITWFLDHFGNSPHSGPLLSLDPNRLSPGEHTLFVYAVDGDQNYGMTKYIIKV